MGRPASVWRRAACPRATNMQVGAGRKPTMSMGVLGRVAGQLGFAVATATIALAVPAALAEKVGVTTAVTLTTTGEPPGLQERQLAIGTDMVANERVVTSANGRAHLLFLDRAALIVGPNSNLVLDEYVFDPKTNTGKAIFSTTKGFFRYVGGALSKNKNAVEFRTPLATIGLRGGIVDVEVTCGRVNAAQSVCARGTTKKVVATKHFGVHVIVTPLGTGTAIGSKTEVKRNGFKAVVVAGRPTVSITRVTQYDLRRNLKKVEGQKGLPPVMAPAAGGNRRFPGTPRRAAQSAVLPDESTDVPDSGASGPPALVAPTAFVTKLNLLAADVAVADAATGSIDSLTDITNQTQDAANQKVLAANLINTGLTYSGWFRLGPVQDFASAVFGLPSTAPTIDAHNILYAGASVSDSVLTLALNGDTFRLPVPSFGGFAVNSDLTNTPFGQVSGTGFISGNPHFFFYNLDFVDTGEFATLFGGSPFTGVFPTSGFATHDFSFGHTIPTEAGGDLFALGNLAIYSAYGTDISGDIANNADVNRSVAGGAALIFDESGGNQRSAIVGFTGNYMQRYSASTGLNSSPLVELAAFGHANARLSEASHPVGTFFGASSAPDAAGNSFFGATGVEYFVLSSQSTSGLFNAPRQDNAVAGYQRLDAAGPGPTGFVVNGYAAPSAPPTDIGATRSTRDIYGYTGGISEIRSGGVFAGDYVFNNTPKVRLVGSESSQTTVALRTNAASSGASLTLQTQDVDSAFGNRYRFGSSPSIGATSVGGSPEAAFIDDDRIILRERSVQAGSENDPAVNVGSIGIGVLGLVPADAAAIGRGGTSLVTVQEPGLVAGKIDLIGQGAKLLVTQQALAPVSGNGDPIERADMLLVTSEVVGNVLPGGVAPCTCDFLKWGYWTADVRTGDATVATDPFRHENIHLATWLAGEIPAAAVVDGFTGTASYSGHIVGAVKNAGNYAIRAGTFNHSYNFGTNTGTFTVRNFDGVNYSGTTTSPVQANDFQAGAITGAGTARVMKLKGSFFSSPTDAVKYNGGNFNIRNPTNTYKAGGIFAGQR